MIKVGIVGYGNLGKGVELAISHQDDMEVYGIFTRRDLKTVKANGSPVFAYNDILAHKDKVDVLVICGSSERDLRKQSLELAQNFNIVDSFDMHALILDHVKKVDKVAKENQTTALVSVGWDPGIFSFQKTMMEAILPQGHTESFWGPGISQGHSDVASRVKGVKMARNYSIPNEDNIEKFRSHQNIDASLNHHKVCYVVCEENADQGQITEDIKNIPYYFAGSKTEVKFISEEEMLTQHGKWAQGGRVIRTAKTSDDNAHKIEFSVKLDSNPEFTSSVLVAYARAVVKMAERQEFGGFTALDVKPKDLSSKDLDTLIKEML